MNIEYKEMTILHRGSFDAYINEEGVLILPLSSRKFIPDSVAFDPEGLYSYLEIAPRTICIHHGWSRQEYAGAMAEFKALLKGHVPDEILNPPSFTPPPNLACREKWEKNQ